MIGAGIRRNFRSDLGGDQLTWRILGGGSVYSRPQCISFIENGSGRCGS
jgi:hypothetical protein